MKVSAANWGMHAAVLLILALGFVARRVVEPADQWLSPSAAHLLGTDEFGRDILFSAFEAAALSLAKGLIIAVATMLLALGLAQFNTLPWGRYPALLTRTLANLIDSIPSVLWVMIVLTVIREPRLFVVGVAFGLVTLPTAAHVLSGELLRLRAAPFVEAAYQLGARESRVLFRYILPNAVAVLIPYAIQIIGAAIAVDGAIGVIGLGNRYDLDLGIFLLRGKENFVLHPQLLLTALGMYAFIYGYLLFCSLHARRASPDV